MTGIDLRRERGLLAREVEASRQTHGKNVFSRKKKAGFWCCFLKNLGDPVIKVLLAALFVNLLLLFRSRDFLESAGIALSVFLATFISTVSEYGSEAAFDRLFESCGAVFCRVRREKIIELPSEEIVVGDAVLLAAGEKIPADGVLLSGRLLVEEAPLTGESRESEKTPYQAGDAVKPGAPGALYSGCTVLSGQGEMRVTAVGDATFLGGISGEIQEEKKESPLKRRLSVLAGQISRIGYAAALFCALSYLFYHLGMETGFSWPLLLERFKDVPGMLSLLLHALMLGLTVVVVAVPEGLPMMIAVVMSANIRRMVRDGVLVRKSAGLEAAGSMNILFTDKTGTLTRGSPALSALITLPGTFRDARELRRHAPGLFDHFLLSAYANNGAVPGERDGKRTAIGGNGTDRALLSAFLSFGAPSYTVGARLLFDSRWKYAATEAIGKGFFVTGAPDRLLPYIKDALDADGNTASFTPTAFTAQLQRHTAAGERVILLCRSSGMPTETSPGTLTLLGAAAFTDPLRPEAARAVKKLRCAGVQVVMMTGDGKETARRIAAECGILTGEGICLSGGELAALDDGALKKLLPRLCVVARALPADKSRLVRLAGEMGLVSGMTGDGINDAPALRRADVGFAMGSGTQVAKEAGDIVLLRDDLATVCRAVLYGRTIFKSIRKFITLQLVMNFCAVGISMIGPFIGFESPVTVVQMLWINLIMDTLGGLAFAGEAPMEIYMREKPKGRAEPILTGAIAGRIAFLSLFTVALSVCFLRLPFFTDHFRVLQDDLCLLTAFFALFIFAGVLNCFNARTDRIRMLSGIGKNPAFLSIMALVAAVQIAFVYLGGRVLRTVPLTPRELIFTLCVAFSVIPVGWLHLLFRRFSGRGGLY